MADEEQQRAWLAYIKVQLRLVYEMNRQLQSDSDLSLADWDVLTALSRKRNRQPDHHHLAAQIGWERSRLSHHVKRMPPEGWSNFVTADADRASHEVRLTAQGRAVLERPLRSRRVDQAAVLHGVPRELLDPLSTALEACTRTSSPRITPFAGNL